MKKIFCLMLALVIGITCACFPAHADIINVTQFQDWDFYGRSDPEFIYITLDTDTVSFYGECETPDTPASPDTPELLSCHVIGVTYPAFSYVFDFYADESVTTYAYAFPAGRYKIYFVGSSSIKKEYVLATFTKLT